MCGPWMASLIQMSLHLIQKSPRVWPREFQSGVVSQTMPGWTRDEGVFQWDRARVWGSCRDIAGDEGFEEEWRH
jgi:hypothetical protein